MDIKYSQYYKKSFSQFGEDLIIHNFFKSIKYKGGKYLDIGGFHPKMISNTHLLHVNGWKGLVVDTLTAKLDLFKIKRGGNIEILNRAVVSNEEKKEKLDFYFFDKPFSEIDTLSYEFAKEKNRERNIPFKKKQINTIRINDLLNKDNFDFVNIDIEGMDEIILNSIDFTKIYKPKLICFEIHDPFKYSDRSSFNNLRKNGYKHLFTSGSSVGFYLV